MFRVEHVGCGFPDNVSNQASETAQELIRRAGREGLSWAINFNGDDPNDNLDFCDIRNLKTPALAELGRGTLKSIDAAKVRMCAPPPSRGVTWRSQVVHPGTKRGLLIPIADLAAAR
jgi:hypothetical protein